ncbi:hypothetical protein [Candidatus Albibeggiatoa sp. nov. NOAA]|uniref:hypothetical protein n=1 Tax=Candidatus Albibeggiatoa sp. nov. NOAA TaxID=3162724 RepID=UPI0032FB45E3|nr:hypothetical protein [Thiotrichaceae bacterium]
MKKPYLGLMIVLSLLANIAWAETLIEVRNAQGQTQQVYIGEDYARMQVTDTKQAAQGYQLIDLKMHKVYMVNSAEKRYFDPSIMRLSQNQRQHQPRQAMPNMPPMFRGQNTPPPVSAELVKVEGDTLEVAGYSTEHYQVMANGQVCSDEYISKQAAELGSIAQFDKTMQAIKEQQQANMPTPPRQHPCAQAHQELEAQIQALGMRMKSVYAMGQLAGKVRTEVVTVKTDSQVADSFYSLEGFTPLTVQEIQQMMQPRRH